MLVLTLILIFGFLIATPFWLFYRQRPEQVNHELQKLPEAASVPLAILLVLIAVETFTGQRATVTPAELWGDITAWLSLGILIQTVGNNFSERNRRVALRILAFGGIVILMRVVSYFVHK